LAGQQIAGANPPMLCDIVNCHFVNGYQSPTVPGLLQVGTNAVMNVYGYPCPQTNAIATGTGALNWQPYGH
jgi:hypothetical protein